MTDKTIKLNKQETQILTNAIDKYLKSLEMLARRYSTISPEFTAITGQQITEAERLQQRINL